MSKLLNRVALVASGVSLLPAVSFAATTNPAGTFDPAAAVTGIDFSSVGAAITAGAGVMLGITALWLAYSFVKRATRRAA